MVLKDCKRCEQEDAKRMLQDAINRFGKEYVVERLHKMRAYAISALATRDPHDCWDVLDDIMPYFLGLIGDTEREL